MVCIVFETTFNVDQFCIKGELEVNRYDVTDAHVALTIFLSIFSLQIFIQFSSNWGPVH